MVEPQPPAPSPFAPTVIRGNVSRRGRLASLWTLGIVAIVVLVINPILAAIAIIVGAGYVGARYHRAIVAAISWDRPHLEIEGHPLVLGATTTLSYWRKPRRLRDVPSCRVVFRLVCEEAATYRQGTDTKTDREHVVDLVTAVEGRGGTRGLEATTTVEVPAGAGAPTFDLGDNEVSWSISVLAEGDGVPTDEQWFRVQVDPVLDPSLRGAEQPRPETPSTEPW